MLASMRAQQAAFLHASSFGGSSDLEDSISDLASPNATSSPPVGSFADVPMLSQHDSQQAVAATQQLHIGQLKAHKGECVICRDGGDGHGPLGLLTYLQVRVI